MMLQMFGYTRRQISDLLAPRTVGSPTEQPIHEQEKDQPCLYNWFSHQIAEISEEIRASEVKEPL
jgi:hypothetical protein